MPRQDSPSEPTRAMRPNPTDRAKLACTSCRRDNKKAQDNRHDEYHPSSSEEKNYSAQQRLHLPPISHPPLHSQPAHSMYDAGSHMSHTGPGPGSHYYYPPPPQNMMGPGQPPQPVAQQPYMQHSPHPPPQHEQRPPASYYPAIDPNIDNDTPASGSNANVYANQSNHAQSQNVGHLGR
ncbi:hypothetical protein DXG03_007784 [Asterophora parasitica]|uniref:Uncharacterized protein n=1 Tax=Asterophora parasitica TaxID=117018 RepID=A0A9P7GIE7_9AGAR|nr:hypothetical protein DXG03_007784 [Asterophora parasitica]